MSTSTINTSLQEQLAEFKNIDLYATDRPHSEYIDNVVVPLLMTKSRGNEGTQEFDRAVSSFVENTLTPKLLEKIQVIAQGVLNTIPATALFGDPGELQKQLPTDAPAIISAKTEVENYLKGSSIADRASKMSLLQYFSICADDILRKKLPLFVNLLDFLQPITAQSILEVISKEENLESLRLANPNQFHNMMWLSLTKYRPYMEEFRDLLTAIDTCSEQERHAFQDPSTTDQKVQQLREKWMNLQKKVSENEQESLPSQTVKEVAEKHGEKTTQDLLTALKKYELTYEGFFEDIFTAFLRLKV